MSQLNEWRVMIARTVDGVILADVSMADYPTFSRALNDAGSWGATVNLSDANNSDINFRSYATSSKWTWVVCYGDFVVQAGPVTTYNITDDNRTLKVGGPGIGGMFKRRVLRNPNGHTAIVDPSQDIAYEGEFLWEVMRRLAHYGTQGSGRYLPIALPPGWPNQGPGNAHRGTYFGYDLAWVWDRMIDLTEMKDGPEFEFAPRLDPDGSRVLWEMRIGTPHLGNLASPSVWDYGSALNRIDVDGDGSVATATHVWSKGSGYERALLTGYDEDTLPILDYYPAQDFVDTEHTSVSDQATLESLADAALAEHRWPHETWKSTVRIDGQNYTTPGTEVSPALGHWALGDAPLFGVIGHPWVADGQYRKRIVGYSSQSPDTVTLDLTEVPS